MRVDSAVRDVAAPTFSGVSLPVATPGAGLPVGTTPQPLTVGQQVANYLPVALAALGLLLIVSLILKYWALVVVLLILIGGGGYLFMYLRASTQGRKAAVATTRAIAASRVATLPDVAAPIASPEPDVTRRVDDSDDVPELPLPEDALTIATTRPLPDDLAVTEAVSLGADDLQAPTQAVSLGADDPQAPTQAVSLGGSDRPAAAGSPADKGETPTPPEP